MDADITVNKSIVPTETDFSVVIAPSKDNLAGYTGCHFDPFGNGSG